MGKTYSMYSIKSSAKRSSIKRKEQREEAKVCFRKLSILSPQVGLRFSPLSIIRGSLYYS